MERRGFLKGLFGGLTAGGVIVTATPADVEAFASPLMKDADLMLAAPSKQATVGVGQHLYNEHGELVAMVTEMHFYTEPAEIDGTSFSHQHRVVTQGFMRSAVDIRATGVGNIRAEQTSPGAIRLRGQAR